MMMKKIYLMVAAIAVIAIASCRKGSFLDTSSTATITKDVAFADSSYTMDYLAELYNDMIFNFQTNIGASGTNNADFSKVSDEAEGKFPALGNFDKVITQGTFAGNFSGELGKEWLGFYKAIHNENIFLAEVDKAPLSAAKKVRVKAETRFLRVLDYSFLTKYFGGVPIIGDKVYDINDKPELDRSTYADCVDYMVKELDAITNSLPSSYSGLDYGRVTKGACLALKSRILLFAASPLYNGGSTAVGTPTTPANPALVPLTAYPTYDQSRWEKARLAAKAVMDLGVYSLNIDNTTPWGGNAAGLGYGFYKLFITRVNNEMILFRPLPTGKQFEASYNPKSRGGGNYFYYPTQELVDAFPTINGKPITADIKSVANPTGYDAANPYVNRDPRMAATIIYNGSLYYLNANKALAEINTYVGAPNDGIVAITSNTSTITGYYVRKFCDENAAVTGGNNVDRSVPIIRYAEILLNYAEATNEMGNAAEAMTTLKQLRIRAGIKAGTDGMYGLPANPTQAEARAIIQNERMIELAFEQHRFWDIRRWKIGAQIDGKFVHGMQITKTGTTYTYKIINVRTRYMKDIYYYWPIPKDDVTISPLLIQNPGY